MSNILGQLYYNRMYNPIMPISETPPPEDKPSYMITIAPRVKALNRVYNMTNPNGNFLFDKYWQPTNRVQKEMVGFIGRLVRFNPKYGNESKPFVGLLENRDDAQKYLNEQKIKYEKIPNEGNALVVISKLNFNFPIPPKMTTMMTRKNKFNVAALLFNKGFKVIESNTINRDIIFQFPTTDPRVIISVFQTYQPPNSKHASNQPVYDFLKYRDERYFYNDITYRYKSVSLPRINKMIKEDTEGLNGFHLLRVNYKTNDTNAIAIKNFIQYTNICITEKGISSESQLETQLKENFTPIMNKGNYAINSSFMIWAEHLDISAYPLFIGYLNEKDFLRK